MGTDFVHVQRNIGHSPRKVRLVADLVRRLSPSEALKILQVTPKAAAKDLAKAIQAAVANTGKDINALMFKRLEVNEGMKLKRYRLGTAGRGRVRPYKRRYSHIKIVLTEAQPEKGGQN